MGSSRWPALPWRRPPPTSSADDFAAPAAVVEVTSASTTTPSKPIAATTVWAATPSASPDGLDRHPKQRVGAPLISCSRVAKQTG